MDALNFIVETFVVIMNFITTYWYIILPVAMAIVALDAYDEFYNDRKITTWFTNH